MRYAVMSDAHGNPHALEKALADARSRGADKTVFLGDAVGYGYDPQACVDIVRTFDHIVLGNHDAGLAGLLSLDWFNRVAARAVTLHRGMVMDDAREWLRGLPYYLQMHESQGRPMFIHGTPEEPIDSFGYVNGASDAMAAFSALHGRFGSSLMFCGHVHMAEAWSFKRDASSGSLKNMMVTSPSESRFNIDGGTEYIFDVGSVGYPRAQPVSSYVIFDDEERSVEYRLLRFDYKGYEERMAKAGMSLPPWFELFKAGKWYNELLEEQAFSEDTDGIDGLAKDFEKDIPHGGRDANVASAETTGGC